MAQSKNRVLPAIVYYVIGSAVLLLATKSLFALVALCVLAAGFFLAGAMLWTNGSYIALGVAAVLLYLRTGSLWYTAGSAALLCGIVLMLGWGLRRKKELAGAIGGTMAVTGAAIFLLFFAYAYHVSGSLDFSSVLAPLSDVKDQVTDALYEPLMQAMQNTQMSAEETIQAVSDMLTVFAQFIDACLSVLPGLSLAVIMIGSYLSHAVAKALLSGKYKERIQTETLTEIRLPRMIGGLFLICFLLALFSSETLARVLSNFLMVFQWAFLFIGAVVVYRLLTRFSASSLMRALTGIIIVLTAIGVPLDLSLAYILIGALDCFFDFRTKFKNFKPPAMTAVRQGMQDFGRHMEDLSGRTGAKPGTPSPEETGPGGEDTQTEETDTSKESGQEQDAVPTQETEPAGNSDKTEYPASEKSEPAAAAREKTNAESGENKENEE